MARLLLIDVTFAETYQQISEHKIYLLLHFFIKNQANILKNSPFCLYAGTGQGNF